MARSTTSSQTVRTDLDTLWIEREPPETWHHPSGVVVCADALEFLGNLKKGTADIVFLDPPFNLGKQYGSRGRRADRRSQEEYHRFMKETLRAAVEALRDGGALFLYHIPQWALRLGSELEKELVFRHWIAVSMKNGFARGNFLYPAHYALLYFTKGEPSSFKRPKIEPLKCRHCGKHVRDYGGYKEYVKNGINLGDVWDDLSPVRHKRNKHRGSNELPLDLLKRVVAISGREGGLFVDPFVGSGTSVVAAVDAGMNFAVCDREQSCCEITKERFVANLEKTDAAPSS